MTGFVPAAYLEVIGDANQEEPITEKQANAVEDSYSNVQVIYILCIYNVSKV